MTRILIIEDDDILRRMLAQALEVAGYTVVQASNGLDGVSAFESGPADLVITDIVMPVQEGVETIMQLHQKNPRLPIIAMSGGMANSRMYLDIAARIGADRVLAKPFSPRQLLRLVDEVLSAHEGGPSDR